MGVPAVLAPKEGLRACTCPGVLNSRCLGGKVRANSENYEALQRGCSSEVDNAVVRSA